MGENVGAEESGVGKAVGLSVGNGVGTSVGRPVGLSVGRTEGDNVGTGHSAEMVNWT